MIKLIKALNLICLVLLSVSCTNNEGKEQKASISVEQAQIVLSGEENTCSIGVTASGSWTAQTDASWCKVAKAGKAVLITVKKNNEGFSRSATVTLECFTAKKVITVKQNASTSKVSFSKNEIIVDATVLETSVDLSSDTEWKITVPEADDWISVAPASGKGNGTIIITMTRNEMAELRESKLMLSYTDNASGEAKQLPLTVKQNASISKVSFSKNEIIVDATVLETSVDLSSNTEWKITVPEADDWISVAPASGEGNDTIVITMTRNEMAELRESKLMLSYTDNASGEAKQLPLTVKQKAISAQISLSQSIINIPRQQGEYIVTLTAEGKWLAKVTGGESWLSVTPLQGVSGKYTITLKVKENPELDIRNAMVHFSGQENKFATLRITQNSMPYKTIRMMSYNVKRCKGMDGKVDYKRTANVINQYQPDFVAIQEVEYKNREYQYVDQLGTLASLTNMVPTFCATVSDLIRKYGIGILSRQKPLSVTKIKLSDAKEDQYKEDRYMVVAEFDDCIFCSTHFSVGESARLSSADLIIDFIKNLKTKKPVFIGGDFNAKPNENSIIKLKQSFEILNDENGYTFPANAPNRTIDYLFMYKNEGAGKKNSSRVIDEPVASDHRPVYADVKFAK